MSESLNFKKKGRREGITCVDSCVFGLNFTLSVSLCLTCPNGGGGIHDKKTGTTHLAELKRSTVCDVESSTSIMIIVLILNDNAVQTTHPDKIIDILVLLIVLLLVVVVGIVVVVGCLCVCHDGGSRSGGGDIG